MCWFSYMFIMTSWCGHNSYGNLPGSLWIPCGSVLHSWAAVLLWQAGTEGMLHQGKFSPAGELCCGCCSADRPCTGALAAAWSGEFLCLWGGSCWCLSADTAPRVTCEESVCEDWRSLVPALTNNEFSSGNFWVLCTPVTIANAPLVWSLKDCNVFRANLWVLNSYFVSCQSCSFLLALKWQLCI